MTLRPLLRFQNPDSTQDLNDRARGIFNKGVFSGGLVTAVPSTLSVSLSPFATVGQDGMFVREDEDATLLATVDGERNYIVVRQKYVVGGSPVVSVESLTEAQYLGDAEQAYLVVFAVVNVPLSATEVLQDYVEYFERDSIDSVGRSFFRGVVGNTGLLPPDADNANLPGDTYAVTDGSGGYPEFWSWSGADWKNVTQAQSMISLLNLHRANLDVDRIHLTSAQADAALGTVGAPNSSNRFVTSIDPRIPNQNENDALQADPTNFSEFSPSGSNRYINSSKIFAIPAETNFPASVSIELSDANGPYYVGVGLASTANKYFNMLYRRDTATNEQEDRELLNSQFQPVRITGVFLDAGLTVALNPSIHADSLGFFSGSSLFLQVSNPADVQFAVAYGKRTLLGSVPPQAFLLRGPQSGQVDARVNQMLTSNVQAQFLNAAFDGGTAPGDVLAFDPGLGQFVQADIGLSIFPVGLRGNSNNVVTEGLYTFPVAPGFSAGDQVYADNAIPGALSTAVNDWFIGTFLSSTRLLVNMNAIALSSSSFVPGVVFPGSLFDGSLLAGEAAAFDGTLFVQWDSSNPATPAPDGIRGNSNNIIQVGKYTSPGTPYTAGVRLYASTSTPGALTSTPNDFFVGHAVGTGGPTSDLLINLTASPLWEDSREVFAAEHNDVSGVHLEGSARVFIATEGDASILTSQSLASSTGMVLYATDTRRVWYCTNGATNTWISGTLSADLNLYVRTDGNDANTGLVNNAGGAFLTIQAAVNKCYSYNQNGSGVSAGPYSININVADGTYTGAVMAGSAFPGNVQIVGNIVTPSNVVLSVTGAHAIQVSNHGTRLYVRGMKIQTTGFGDCLLAFLGGHLIINGVMNFGVCAGSHMRSEFGGAQITIESANYTISGGAAACHYFSGGGASIYYQSATVTLTGTPAFGTAFIHTETCGSTRINAVTYMGLATGTRYSAILNGVIDSQGSGANYYPGSSIGGTTATGGQYN